MKTTTTILDCHKHCLISTAGLVAKGRLAAVGVLGSPRWAAFGIRVADRRRFLGPCHFAETGRNVWHCSAENKLGPGAESSA